MGTNSSENLSTTISTHTLKNACVKIDAYSSPLPLFSIQGYLQEVSAHTLEYESLLANSDKWGDHLIPDESGGNLPSPSEPSPPPFSGDCLNQALHP